MSNRTSIFGPPVASALDVSDFSPRSQPEARPRAEDIDAASAGSRFQSREPSTDASVDAKKTHRQPMVYRTGRSVTFSAKTTQQTVDQFYALAQQHGWKAGETFEKAVEALVRETSGASSADNKPPR